MLTSKPFLGSAGPLLESRVTHSTYAELAQHVATCNDRVAGHGSSRFHSQDILPIASAPPRLRASSTRVTSTLLSVPVASHNHTKFTKKSDCNCRIAPNTVAQQAIRSKAASHQNFSWKFLLSSTLGQQTQQRHHLDLGTRQAVGDDMGAPVLCGRHIQQQRVPERLGARDLQGRH